MPPIERVSKTDYAKWSLYLGAISAIGAGIYGYWQYTNAKNELRYKAKYEEVKNAVRQLQQAYGLPTTGKFDEPTKALLTRLGAQEREPRSGAL